ncbi:MAG: hypothetical protein ACRDNS_14405 [Trebonia sp.]
MSWLQFSWPRPGTRYRHQPVSVGEVRPIVLPRMPYSLRALSSIWMSLAWTWQTMPDFSARLRAVRGSMPSQLVLHRDRFPY